VKELAAPVEQIITCSPRSSVGLRLGDELAGEDVFAPVSREFDSHVYKFDGGQRAVHHAGEHFDACVAAALGVWPSFPARAWPNQEPRRLS